MTQTNPHKLEEIFLRLAVALEMQENIANGCLIQIIFVFHIKDAFVIQSDQYDKTYYKLKIILYVNKISYIFTDC